MKLSMKREASINLLALFIALVAFPARAAESRDMVVWGDQGDGTFRNPVLNADYPDSDVEKSGDTYYMISSTVFYAPGMAVLQSKDLVNWSLLTHIWPRLSWETNYDATAMNGYSWGVWAGDLAYNGDRWFCAQIDFQSGLYISSATNIAGPWSEPHCLLKKKKWTDPALYFDQEKKEAWLLCNFGPPGEGQHEQRLFKLAWDGSKLLDEGKPIWHGNRSEAAKIHRIDGRWWIFLIDWQPGADGKGNDRRQLALRSTTDSIYGPYESRVVMQRGNGFTHSACQGSLLQVPDGSWWFIHQLIQNGDPIFQGRAQCLQPVTWTNGWPIIGVDVNGDGVGEPVWSARKPITGFPIVVPQTGDEFSAAKLGPQWEWNHNPRDDRWSLTERPGWLRLKAGQPVNTGGFWNAANTISQRHMGTGRGTATARLDLAGVKPGQQAGLCHHSGKFQMIGVRVAADGKRILIFNNNGKEQSGPELTGNELWLRSEMNADQTQFAYSLDGAKWENFGAEFKTTFGHWRGDRIGFYCWNDTTDDVKQSGQLDVDWFHYEFAGPKK